MDVKCGGRVISVRRYSETWPKNRSTLSPNSDFLIIFSREEESLRFEILRRRSTKDAEGHGPRILPDALSQGDCELARPRTRRNCPPSSPLLPLHQLFPFFWLLRIFSFLRQPAKVFPHPAAVSRNHTSPLRLQNECLG